MSKLKDRSLASSFKLTFLSNSDDFTIANFLHTLRRAGFDTEIFLPARDSDGFIVQVHNFDAVDPCDGEFATALVKLAAATRSLREWQKQYMANRGNDQIGKAVGQAAAIVDECLAKVDALSSNNGSNPPGETL